MSEESKIYDVCIVGAGFSGLVLAIKLSRAGLMVCLVELNRIVGRKILSTGNGRCNFTNSRQGSKYYYSNHNLDFLQDKNNELREFLRVIGVIERDLDGYFYPITNQAKTVRDSLENEIYNLNIPLFLDNRVTDIKKKDMFCVTTNRTEIIAKNVAVCSGGLSAASLGSSKIGYKIARKFQMNVTALAPALVGAKSNDIALKNLAGVRVLGKVSYRDVCCEGEIQFTKDGISGYPVMCISRYIGLDELSKKLSNLSLDFVPYMSDDELSFELQARFTRNPKQNIIAALTGITNEKVVEEVVSYARIYADTTVDRLDEEDKNNLIQYFKNFPFSINGTKGFDSSQVTAGGVDLEDIDLDTMESKCCKGLYFAGEVLDVDGICGGYNLTWAYYSADVLAQGIIKRFT